MDLRISLRAMINVLLTKFFINEGYKLESYGCYSKNVEVYICCCVTYSVREYVFKTGQRNLFQNFIKS